ncbi:cytochrome ubiquinol oxidase subunit I [Deefgea salmonis]|uniref:Cytochrome ubiquinol oxidase subunit I n=1 Tax=Deefgea salmonis TaxID=2875502 RepID=A0ABS8BHC9_9NEIS|nr:cytochrome ubiquinol oxidase subunit I [Deefgea salmonis]MCB5195109.1 cytochrome ubiquinol oxidase subunit I [Deefgea salmonis]
MLPEATGLLDPIVLARIQFAANITFHILFPTISIAMGWALLFFKLRFNATGEQKWLDAYGFWVKIFALTFALGVVTGITMSFQFGTNWPGFMKTVGNIAGPLLAYEVLTAFFLEATFLGIMLFGQKKVSNRIHTLATVLVAGGTTLSAFWIIALNSWMQTPVGFEMINGQAHATDWLAIIFNPSMPYHLSHMLLASGLTVAFLLAGVSAFRWLKGQRDASIMASLKTGVFLAAALIPLQIFLGDLHGINTLKHQPAKIAAIEGIWHTERGAPLTLFALPNAATQTNEYAIAIPKLASLILTHDINGELQGINAFADHPPVAKVFWSFRVMVGMGMLMLLVSWLAAWQLRGGKTLSPMVCKLLIGMTFSGWVATVAGWYVTEIGRQPWLVYGVLKTSDAASNVGGGMILSTLIMYLTLYAFLLVSYISVVFYLANKAGRPAQEQ